MNESISELDKLINDKIRLEEATEIYRKQINNLNECKTELENEVKMIKSEMENLKKEKDEEIDKLNDVLKERETT